MLTSIIYTTPTPNRTVTELHHVKEQTDLIHLVSVWRVTVAHEGHSQGGGGCPEPLPPKNVQFKYGGPVWSYETLNMNLYIRNHRQQQVWQRPCHDYWCSADRFCIVTSRCDQDTQPVLGLTGADDRLICPFTGHTVLRECSLCPYVPGIAFKHSSAGIREGDRGTPREGAHSVFWLTRIWTACACSKKKRKR